MVLEAFNLLLLRLDGLFRQVLLLLQQIALLVRFTLLALEDDNLLIKFFLLLQAAIVEYFVLLQENRIVRLHEALQHYAELDLVPADVVDHVEEAAIQPVHLAEQLVVAVVLQDALLVHARPAMRRQKSL